VKVKGGVLVAFPSIMEDSVITLRVVPEAKRAKSVSTPPALFLVSEE